MSRHCLALMRLHTATDVAGCYPRTMGTVTRAEGPADEWSGHLRIEKLGWEERPGTPQYKAINSTTKRKFSCHIGRRVDKKGPRSTAHQAVRSEKCATGELNILQINICGISNKKVELAHLFHETRANVVLLQETLHRSTDLTISGYTPYPCECTNCQGVITYLRNDQQGTVENITIASPVEFQKISVWHHGSKYIVYNVYNPPANACSFPHLTDPTYYKT